MPGINIAACVVLVKTQVPAHDRIYVTILNTNWQRKYFSNDNVVNGSIIYNLRTRTSIDYHSTSISRSVLNRVIPS